MRGKKLVEVKRKVQLRIKIRKTKSSWLFEIVACKAQTVLQVYVTETT